MSVVITVPTAAFIASASANGVPATMVSGVVADESVDPVPPAPEKMVKANVSLPTGAENPIVQLREPDTVVHNVDVALTSNVCAAPAFTLKVTDDALGDTNCGYRALDAASDDEPVAVGIEITALPDCA